jgi:hypothetical protein
MRDTKWFDKKRRLETRVCGREIVGWFSMVLCALYVLGRQGGGGGAIMSPRGVWRVLRGGFMDGLGFWVHVEVAALIGSPRALGSRLRLFVHC